MEEELSALESQVRTIVLTKGVNKGKSAKQANFSMDFMGEFTVLAVIDMSYFNFLLNSYQR